MIITDKFIWFHLGKTAGDMFHYLCNEYIGKHILYQHNIKDPQKHNDYTHIPNEHKHIKNYLIGFRKLSSWIVSHNRHHLRKCKELSLEDVQRCTEEGILIFDDSISVHKPDDLLNSYLGDLDKIQFIRQEYLIQDFIDIIGKYYKVDSNIIQDQTKQNMNDQAPNIKITKANIEKIYTQNPIWHNLEKTLYA